MTHCIIIGSTRCGTTSLYNYLGAHPKIKMARKGGKREVHFFDYAHHWTQGLGWYWQQFPTTAAPVTLETSPTMLQHWLAPDRLAQLIPDCKIIVLMRNPVDRAYSDYLLAFRKRWTTRPFEADIRSETRRLTWEQETPDFWESHFYLSETHLCGFLERGLYAKHLTRWLEFFPQEQMLLLQSETLFQHPEGIVMDAWHWLGLEQAPLPRFRHWQQQIYNPMSRGTRKWLDSYFERPNGGLQEYVSWNW